MQKLLLLVGTILMNGFLISQPVSTVADNKIAADFNHRVIEAIKAKDFAFVYRSLDIKREGDTIGLAQTLTRYSAETAKAGYQETSVGAGRIQKPDKSFLLLFMNSWKISGEEQFSIDLRLEKKGSAFIIEHVEFTCKIKTLLSAEESARDSMNVALRTAIKQNNPDAVYAMFLPGIKIDKTALTKIIKSYSSVLADTTLRLYDNTPNGRAAFPHAFADGPEINSFFCFSSWTKGDDITIALIEATVVQKNGKYFFEKVRFASSLEKLKSMDFPGGSIDPSEVIPPPAPPPPPPPMPR